MVMRLGWLPWIALAASCSDLPTGFDGSECGFPNADLVADEDGDGILFAHERDFDDDGDGLVNDRDRDADGDGLSDAEEIGTRLSICYPPQDSDGDGLADFRDVDSDNDGLRDDEELAGETYYLDPDTDRDGCLDGAEEALDGCSDPRDLAISVECGAERRGLVTFRWTGPPLPSVSLEVRVPDEGDRTHYAFGTIPHAVLPATGAELVPVDPGEPASFLMVETGATLIFGVEYFDVRAAALRTEGQLALLGPAGELIDQGRLLILGERSCSVRRP